MQIQYISSSSGFHITFSNTQKNHKEQKGNKAIAMMRRKSPRSENIYLISGFATVALRIYLTSGFATVALRI